MSIFALRISLLAVLLLTPFLSPAATLSLTFRAVFNSDPLLLDSLRYANSASETLSVTRLSYLVSGIALQREDGAWTELSGQVGWIDAEARRSVITLGDVPAAQYRAIRFHVGLDSETNNADPAKWPPDHPLNPNLNGLHWSWQGGYIFLALEGRYRANGAEIKGYAYHLARDPNRSCISLIAALDLVHGDSTVALDFDIAALLNAPRPLSFERDGTATHSRDADPVAAALLSNLPGAFRVRQIVSSAPEITRPTEVKPLYLPEHFTPYRFTMNGTFPIPALPRDNPLLVERVTLGERIFHETALSRDGTLSCASCHTAEAALSDSRRFSIGVRNQIGARHAMPLQNLAWKTNYFWDGRAPSLRAQALMPIQDHTEMDETLDRVCEKLATNGQYPPLFQAAFGSPEITAEKIGLAVENFLLTLTVGNAKFDQAMRGKASLTSQEQQGFELFMTEYEPRTGQHGADCFHCHGGPLFSDHAFHNNGLALSSEDPGRFRATAAEGDRGKFATPSLRNIAKRGPYMHDGRFATLEQVIAHYSGPMERTPTLDPNLAKHPTEGLGLSADDQAALIAFLKTLSDE